MCKFGKKIVYLWAEFLSINERPRLKFQVIHSVLLFESTHPFSYFKSVSMGTRSTKNTCQFPEATLNVLRWRRSSTVHPSPCEYPAAIHAFFRSMFSISSTATIVWCRCIEISPSANAMWIIFFQQFATIWRHHTHTHGVINEFLFCDGEKKLGLVMFECIFRGCYQVYYVKSTSHFSVTHRLATTVYEKAFKM